MSHSSSPTNRGSIFGWVKNLKRGSLMSNDSVNEVGSDNELLAPDQKALPQLNTSQLQPIPLPQHSHLDSIYHQSQQSIHSPSGTLPPGASAGGGSTGFFQSSSPHQEFLRPLLHHKSRSTNNVNRVRSNSLNQSEKSSSIRQHRDSFLQHNPLVDENSKYFGVTLEDAINQAAAKISILTNESTDHVLQYGKIPIVVAKCGVYLKKNGLTVEGIFRVGGSSKRLKELQLTFNTPPDFGKKLNWDGYTVHDAASILRRYLNALPEPLIPLELYEEFRDPLRKRTRIINYMKYKAEYPNKSLKTAAAASSSSNINVPPPDAKTSAAAATSTATNNNTNTNTNTNTNINTNVDNTNTTNAAPPTNSTVPADLNSTPDTSQPLTEANIGRLNSTTSATSSDNAASSRNQLQSQQPNNKHVSTSDLSQVKSNSENIEDPLPASQSQLQFQEMLDDQAAASKRKKSKNYKKLARDVHEAIGEYKTLVDDLPMLSKQLLFYILDLLAMVQNHSQENLMSSRNLAAIFQPSILSHPNHDMDPIEYALSQSVVEFLIQYAYKLLPNQNGGSSNPNQSHSRPGSAGGAGGVGGANAGSDAKSGPNDGACGDTAPGANNDATNTKTGASGPVDAEEGASNTEGGDAPRNGSPVNESKTESTPNDKLNEANGKGKLADAPDFKASVPDNSASAGSSALLNKPPQPSFRRKHSKSLSSTSNHEDLIGYSPAGSKNLGFSDTSDNEFEITDCEDSNNDTQSDLGDVNFNPSLKLNADDSVSGYDSGSDFNFDNNDDENAFSFHQFDDRFKNNTTAVSSTHGGTATESVAATPPTAGNNNDPSSGKGHQDASDGNHGSLLNKLANDENSKEGDDRTLTSPPNVAIIVSTPSSSSVPRMENEQQS